MIWKEAAMDKLRRYEAMRQALRNIPEEIDRLKEEIDTIRGADPSRIAVRGCGSRREDALIDNLVQQQELAWTLKRVKRWLLVADRGLSALLPDEKLVLQRLYLHPEKGAMERLCSELGVEQSSVYRKRDQALCRFTTALYGFCEA
ncbi:MAG: hypothetical protein IJA74_01590 [Oscillospiraceae bacterium]|nr:hypothetical protein [Oscillospiraceae bacterium]